MSNVHPIMRDSDDLPQRTVESILYLFRIGNIPNEIAISLGLSLEKVIQVLFQANDDDLFKNLIKKFCRKSNNYDVRSPES